MGNVIFQTRCNIRYTTQVITLTSWTLPIIAKDLALPVTNSTYSTTSSSLYKSMLALEKVDASRCKRRYEGRERSRYENQTKRGSGKKQKVDKRDDWSLDRDGRRRKRNMSRAALWAIFSQFLGLLPGYSQLDLK